MFLAIQSSREWWFLVINTELVVFGHKHGIGGFRCLRAVVLMNKSIISVFLTVLTTFRGFGDLRGD